MLQVRNTDYKSKREAYFSGDVHGAQCVRMYLKAYLKTKAHFNISIRKNEAAYEHMH